MFPEETHQNIVKQIDEIEAELYRLYRRLEGLRLQLQEQWKVLPSGARWTKEAHCGTADFVKVPTGERG